MHPAALCREGHECWAASPLLHVDDATFTRAQLPPQSDPCELIGRAATGLAGVVHSPHVQRAARACAGDWVAKCVQRD